MVSPTVGVLALQGAFAKHINMLNSLGVHSIEVRKPSELFTCDALVIPGGESSTMLHQIRFINFLEPLRQFTKEKPVFGTCAGLILMSGELGLLDMEVERNGFGRQDVSFTAPLDSECFDSFPAVFIRAPRIKKISSDIKILASFQKEPVLVQKKRYLAASFHPEITFNSNIHQYFISII